MLKRCVVLYAQDALSEDSELVSEPSASAGGAGLECDRYASLHRLSAAGASGILLWRQSPQTGGKLITPRHRLCETCESD